jgi:hypothetical protein
VTWVPPTWAGLHDALMAGPWHVLHVIGHGDFDPVRDEGVLALTRPDGWPDIVEASRLADLLRQARPMPRLVVLNSCSGAGAGGDLFSGTAAALARSGVAAVAAMQFTISDPAAVAFADGFYAALARGRGVDEAVSAGRIAILGTSGRTLEWITPVLYLRDPDARLFIIWPGPAPQPGPPGTFEMRWTGAEPLSSFTNMRSAVWQLIAAAVVLVGGGALSGDRGLLWAAAATAALFGLGYALAVPRMRKTMGWWSVRVGPESLQARGDWDSHDFQWESISSLRMGPVRCRKPELRFTGLYARPARGNRIPPDRLPTGWPAGTRLRRRRDSFVPVCILGPMTKAQRTELADALARHAGPRWDPAPLRSVTLEAARNLWASLEA